MREGTVKNRYTVDKTKKDSRDITVGINESIEIAHYCNTLQECLDSYLKHFEMADTVARFDIEEHTFNIQKYPPRGGFKYWHYENSGHVLSLHRHLVFMTYLNDVKHGGTEFMYQNLEIQAEKGKTVIWPAIWTHTHRGVVSEDETKYIATGWYTFVKGQSL